MTNWQFSAFSITLCFSAIFALWLAFVSWRRRSIPPGNYLALLMLAVAEWSLAYALETAAVSSPAKIFWAQVGYLGVHGVPTLFLILALRYSQQDRWLTHRNLILLWIVPLLTITLAATNQWHGWVWDDFTPDPTPGANLLIFHHGPWFWFATVYSYLVVLLAIALLVRAALRSSSLHRRQAWALVLGALFPWLMNVLYVLRWGPLPGRNLTPHAFTLTGLFLVWNLYRLRLLDLMPVARHRLVDTMSAAVIVVDIQGRVADINPAAQAIIDISARDAVGQPVQQILSHWPSLAASFQIMPDTPTVRRLIQDKANRWYDSLISPLRDPSGRTAGWLVTLHDVTQHRHAEAEIARLATVIEQAAETVVITDIDGNIIYANPHFEVTTGYSVTEALGQNPRILKSGHQDRTFYQDLWRTILDGETWQGTFINKHKDGDLYHEAATIFPIKNPAGEIINFAAVKRDITAQVQAEDALRAYARHQELLNNITQAALEQVDFQHMLQTLADRLGELFEADGCFITLWDEAQGQATPGAAYGSMRETYVSTARPEPGETTLTESVLRAGRALVIEDISTSQLISPRLASQYPTRSVLALPLIANQRRLGAVLVAFHTQRTFTSEEIARGEYVARHIALAIMKAHLLETAQRRATEAETLRQAAAVIVSTLEQPEIIDRILEQLAHVVPYDSASVQLLREDRMEIVGGRGFPNRSQVIGLHFPLDGENPLASILERRQPLILDDTQISYAAFRHPPHDRVRGWMGVPIIVQDRLIGLITLDSERPGRFTPEHARLAVAFADQVAIALENARLFAQIQHLAITDSLTGIHNRRHFFAIAEREFQRASRYDHPFSIIMLDIDQFKQVNDTHGHRIGDQVLVAVAKRCGETLRAADVLARYGGEEFVIMLPETSLEHAKSTAERLRSQIAEEPIETTVGSVSITISAGVAERRIGSPVSADPANSIDALIDQADQALYNAKQSGRNRVSTYEDLTGF